MPDLPMTPDNAGEGKVMSSRAKKRAVRAKVFADQGGLCASCDTPMVLPETLPPSRRPRPDAASLYHLYSRYNVMRSQQHHAASYIVVCTKCANALSAAETSMRSLADLYARSGRYPRALVNTKDHTA